MDELLNCPFCGGEADCNNNGVQDKDGNPIWWVECLNCGANLEGDNNTKEASMKAWNRRHSPRPEALTVDAKYSLGAAHCGECACKLYHWYSFCPDCGTGIKWPGKAAKPEAEGD